MDALLTLVPNPDAAVPDLRSVPALLRNIAADIEAGEYGVREAIGQCGEDRVVARGALVLCVSGRSAPSVFGLGDTDSAQAFMDFHAGANELMAIVVGTER